MTILKAFGSGVSPLSANIKKPLRLSEQHYAILFNDILEAFLPTFIYLSACGERGLASIRYFEREKTID
jgi:hypothetical protein